MAITSCGLANFTPMERILFFAIPGPKIPHSHFEEGGNVALSARVWRKLFFAIPGPKTPHSRFGAERECGTFGQGVAKTYNLFIQFSFERSHFFLIQLQGEAPISKLENVLNLRSNFQLFIKFVDKPAND